MPPPSIEATYLAAVNNSRYAWEADHRRRREAFARGEGFRQYTWDDAEQPRLMLRELGELLKR